MVPVFKNVGERSTVKTTALLVFFLCKGFKKIVNNTLVDHQEKCSLISSMVLLGLFDQR